MDIYERFGREVERREQETAAHSQTIAVLRGLKQGELTLDQLQVDPDSDNWSITPRLTIVVENPDDGEAVAEDDLRVEAAN